MVEQPQTQQHKGDSFRVFFLQRSCTFRLVSDVTTSLRMQDRTRHRNWSAVEAAKGLTMARRSSHTNTEPRADKGAHTPARWKSLRQRSYGLLFYSVLLAFLLCSLPFPFFLRRMRGPTNVCKCVCRRGYDLCSTHPYSFLLLCQAFIRIFSSIFAISYCSTAQTYERAHTHRHCNTHKRVTVVLRNPTVETRSNCKRNTAIIQDKSSPSKGTGVFACPFVVQRKRGVGGIRDSAQMCLG